MNKNQSLNGYRLAVIQFEPVLLDKESNLTQITDLAHRAADSGADMAIFPECCLTGYPVNPTLSREVCKLAETIDKSDRGKHITALENLSRDLGIYLVVGVVERLVDGSANSAVIISPKIGIAGRYRKSHLWTPDRGFFTPGEHFPTYNAPRGRFGSLICFDFEFPEAARLLALQDNIGLITAPTATMKPWEHYLDVYSQARAMENHVFFAVANYTGTVETTEFFGGSVIVDPYGRVLAKAGTNEAILVADIDLDLCSRVKNELEYFRERRPELYAPISSS